MRRDKTRGVDPNESKLEICGRKIGDAGSGMVGRVQRC